MPTELASLLVSSVADIYVDRNFLFQSLDGLQLESLSRGDGGTKRQTVLLAVPVVVHVWIIDPSRDLSDRRPLSSCTRRKKKERIEKEPTHAPFFFCSLVPVFSSRSLSNHLSYLMSLRCVVPGAEEGDRVSFWGRKRRKTTSFSSFQQLKKVVYSLSSYQRKKVI